MANENQKTYITEANTGALIIVWVVSLLGLDMPAPVAVSVVTVINIALRYMIKRGWL